MVRKAGELMRNQSHERAVLMAEEMGKPIKEGVSEAEKCAWACDYYADNIFSFGAAYLIKQNIQIDASLSRNFKDTPEILYGGIGFSWRFDKNYKPVKLEKNDDEEKGKTKGDKKRDKQKEETKKRLEEEL